MKWAMSKLKSNEMSMNFIWGGLRAGPLYMGYRGNAYYVIQKKRSPAKNFPQMTRQCVSRHTEKISREKFPAPHCLANGVHVIGACFTDDTKRKHLMSICVSKSDLFYMKYHPLSPFSHSQSFGVPMISFFPACGWNNHGEYPQYVLACTDDVSVTNMFTLARVSHTCWFISSYPTFRLYMLKWDWLPLHKSVLWRRYRSAYIVSLHFLMFRSNTWVDP